MYRRSATDALFAALRVMAAAACMTLACVSGASAQSREFMMNECPSAAQTHFHDFTARIFIGSFNFDPRSARLNTEMGFVIDSQAIATALSRSLDRRETVYVLSSDAEGDIVWSETRDSGETVTYAHEPNTTAFQRGLVRFMSWLPFEWML